MRMGLFYWIPANSTEQQQAEGLEKVTVEARVFERAARSWIPSYRVFPFLIVSDTIPSLGGATSRREMRDAAAGFELDYWQRWGGYKQGRCGEAYQPGTESIVFGQCQTPTTAHEGIGHSNNCGHSKVIVNGVIKEYAGRDYMGGGAGRKGFNMPHLMELQRRLGALVRPFRWGPANVSQEVYLRPLECEVEALSTAFNGVVAGGLYLSHNTTRGHVDAVRDVYEGRIKVHRFDPSDNSTVRIAELYPGNARTEGDTLIEYLHYDSTDRTAKLRIWVDGQAPEPTEWPTLFGELPEGAGPVEASYLGDPDHPSEGLDVQVFPEKNLGTVFGYTYGIEQDDKEFFFGSFPLDDPSAIFTLWSVEGGTFQDSSNSTSGRPGPAAAEEYKIGDARIYQLDGKVILCRNTVEYGIGADVMEPIVNDLTGLGAWSTRPNEGMTLSMVGNDLLTGFLWTYGPARRNHFGVSIEGTTSRWFIVQAERTDGDQFEGIFKEVSGEDLYWRTFYKGEEIPVGKCTFDLADIEQNKIVCDYEINSPSGVAGSGTWNMTPVVGE